MNVPLKTLIGRASPQLLDRVRLLLEQDDADQAWASQVGPALVESDVATLLGTSIYEVATDPALIRVTNRDGSVLYPVVQFDGDRVLPGLAEVVTVVREVTDSLGALAWLTGTLREMDARPVDLLRDGHIDPVRSAALRFADKQ